MQALARPKALFTLVVFIVAVVVGLVYLRGPLEIPSLQIEPVTEIAGYPLRSSVIQTWLGMIVLILLAFLGTRRMALVPGRLQALVESVVELLLNLCETAAGPRNGRRFFPVVASIFLFVLAVNWLGFIPGTGTVGTFIPAEEVIEEVQHKAEEQGKNANLSGVPLFVVDAATHNVTLGLSEHEVTAEEWEHGKREELESRGLTAGHINPFLRPASTDVNTPFALAIWSAIFVEFWGVSSLGLFSYLGKFFNVGRLVRGQIAFGLIDLFVGLIDFVSELVRLISFTFRLFGNIFAGEILILMISFFFPLVFVVGVFFMEIFFGMIQAFIFAVLTLIFGIMAVTSHGAEGGHGAEH